MSTHNSQIERSISRLNQTAYGTPRANSDAFRRIISDSANIAALTTNFVDDAGYDNGSDVKSDKWAETATAESTMTPDLCFQDIGFDLKDALGGYSVSGSDPYVHVFTPQDMNVSRQLPSRTGLEKYGGLLLRRIDDLVCTQFTVSAGKTGRIKVSVTRMGSGRYADDPAGYSSPAIVQDREWGYTSQAFFRLYDPSIGTNQVETATAVGTTTGIGNVEVTITASGLTGSPLTVIVPVANADTASAWASKVRTALRSNAVINAFAEVSGSGPSIILTKRKREADDATFNIALANGTPSPGITAAPTSASTTAGVVGDSQDFTCAIETWQLAINNPPAEEGYRVCSPYVIAGNPKSGQTRSELLVGARDLRFTYTARLLANDKARDWMQQGTDVALYIPIIGTESGDSHLIFTHTRAKIDQAQEIPDAGGGFIGIQGGVDLMSSGTGGTIPFTAELMNDVASYAS